MEKEKIKVKVSIVLEKQFKPNYLDASREFTVEKTRAMLFRSLDAIERKLLKLYPEKNEQGNE